MITRANVGLVCSSLVAIAVGFFPLSQPAQAQAPAPTPQQPAPPAPPEGRGRGGIASFPAQQRPPGDPTVIARGSTIYGIECRACHGVDLRGGDLGGPNLLRSQVVLNDLGGELLLPIIRGSRKDQGMPAIAMSEDDARAVSLYFQSVLASARGQGAPPAPAGPPVVLNILVGDASAGQSYFQARCRSCHSETGDLRGVASRVSDPVQLQNLWVSGGGRGGRGAAASPDPARRQVVATVTLPSGQQFQGPLVRIDDFLVTLIAADGRQRTFPRDGDVPKVDLRDPLEGHRSLLPVYTDKDIHDVTAYLVTLK